MPDNARMPTVVLTDRYAQAVAYASAIHADQVRKGTDTTYLCHLLGVSSLVLEAGGTEDEAIAGLLHDSVEDAGGLAREKDVRAAFGDTVARWPTGGHVLMRFRWLGVFAAVLGATIVLAPSVDAVPDTDSAGPGIRLQLLPIDPTADIWAWPADPQAWPARDSPPMRIFGRDYQGKVEQAMTIDMLKIGTPVRAAYPGRVLRVTSQPETCDAEVYIDSTRANGSIHGSYDHILPTVKKGQLVKAGDIIGTVPAWQCDKPQGGFELMLVQVTARGSRSVCPMSVMAPAQASRMRHQVLDLMQRWNAAPQNFPSKYTEADLARSDICEVPVTSAASAHTGTG